MTTETIVIVSAVRTPVGAFQGHFKDWSATDLGAAAISACYQNNSLPQDIISDVIMGCVLSAGTGQAPARQAVIKSGLSPSINALTVNKVCGSGLKSVMLAHDLLHHQTCQIIIAGGMESMTNAPYLLSKARSGYRMGHAQMFDHMILDGLEDAYHKNTAMGVFAERTASRYGFNRQSQDDYAIATVQRALLAQQNHFFKDEITPLTVVNKTEKTVIDYDETPLKIKLEKIPNLKPAFQQDGTVTAASSSSISDGAAAVAVTTLASAERYNMQPLACIVGHASHSQEPEWFTTAPVGAIDKLLKKIGWQIDDVDLFEINEAFAVVPMAAIHDLNIQPDKVNVHGGACALGHPIGASGARILVTLIHALKRLGLRRGVAALCIGGGESVAMAVECIHH